MENNDGEYSIDNMASRTSNQTDNCSTEEQHVLLQPYRDMQAVGCLFLGLLLPPDTRIKKRKKRLRKSSSDDNLQIIIVKFAIYFLGLYF